MSARCIHPWADIWVNARGLVFCCPQQSTVLGNLYEDPFEQIWNGPPARRLRKLITQKRYREAGCDRECPFLRGSYHPPEKLPPVQELINPVFDSVDDDSAYAANHLAMRKHFRQGDQVLSSKPLFLDLQPLLRCNSSCIMCGQPHESPLRHHPELYGPLYPLRKYANYVRWQGGEVFLIRNFSAIVAEFSGHAFPHLKPYIITNGTLLTPKIMDELTERTPPAFFLISIDGATETVYNRVRKKLDFQAAFSALAYLAAIRAEKYPHAIVRWNYVVMRSTIGDMIPAIEQAEQLGVPINFAPVQGPYRRENIFRYQYDLDPYLKQLEQARIRALQSTVEVSGFTGIFDRLENFSSKNSDN